MGTAPAALTGSANFTVGSVFQVLEESLVLGAAHTCGLTITGAAYCWGYGEVGQLGDNTPANHHTPAAVILGDRKDLLTDRGTPVDLSSHDARRTTSRSRAFISS